MKFAIGFDRWLYVFGELGAHQLSVNFSAARAKLDQATKNTVIQSIANKASGYQQLKVFRRR